MAWQRFKLEPTRRKRSIAAIKKSSKERYLLPNVLIPEEKPDSEVFCRHILAIPHDQFADTSEHNIFDRLRRDATQVDHENRSIPHPVIVIYQ